MQSFELVQRTAGNDSRRPAKKRLPPKPKIAPILLSARDAEKTGNVRYVKEQDCFGYWQSSEAVVSWNVKIAASGRYAVAINQGCSEDSPGATYVVKVGEHRLTGRVVTTGPGHKGWENFRVVPLGVVKLSAGSYQVSVKALSKPSINVMNLRDIRLVPYKR